MEYPQPYEVSNQYIKDAVEAIKTKDYLKAFKSALKQVRKPKKGGDE